jgi:hypothetical protein
MYFHSQTVFELENELEQIDSGKLSEKMHLRITNKAKVMACKNYAQTQI